MPKKITVKQGQTMSSIAELYGFRDYHTIWDDGANAALKAKRKNPNVLHPGDEVTIPDKQEKQESRETTAHHVFQVKQSKLFLRLKTLDLDFVPLKNSAYEVALEDKESPRTGSTDKDAILKEEIHVPVAKVVDAEAKVTEVPKKGDPRDHKFDLKIGHLDPVHKLSGQQARLNNLGYFAGFDPKDQTQLLWAVEEFNENHILKGATKVKKTPTIVPETDDPDEKTGLIDDDALLAKLEEIHGC